MKQIYPVDKDKKALVEPVTTGRHMECRVLLGASRCLKQSCDCSSASSFVPVVRDVR